MINIPNFERFYLQFVDFLLFDVFYLLVLLFVIRSALEILHYAEIPKLADVDVSAFLIFLKDEGVFAKCDYVKILRNVLYLLDCPLLEYTNCT